MRVLIVSECSGTVRDAFAAKSENLTALLHWLETHEDDITNGVDDYADLSGVFFELFDRHPGESDDTGILY